MSRQGAIAGWVSIAMLAALAPACGGDSDEKRDIADVLDQTRDAVLAGDGRAACARMTANARRRTLELPRAGYTATERIPPGGCAQVIARVSAEGREHRSGDAIVDEEAWHRDAPEAKFQVTDVSGDSATATIEVDGSDAGVRIGLRKVDGHWLIDDAEGIIATE